MQREHRVRALRNEFRHEQRKRRDHHDDRRNARVLGKHESERAQNRHNAGKQLRKAHQKAVRKRLRVRNHAADNLAVRMRIDIGKRQHRDFLQRVLAQILNDRKRHAVVDRVHQPLNQRCDRHNYQNFDQNRQDFIEEYAVIGDLIDRFARVNRHQQRKHHRDRREEERREHIIFVFADVGQHPPERSALIRLHAFASPPYCDS